MGADRPQSLPPDLAAALARLGSRRRWLGSPVLYFPTVGSTNDVAAELASRGECGGAVIVADTQTAGRGRRGRSWFSPPASGLYVSVIVSLARARVSADRAIALVTLAAAVALSESIETLTGLPPAIKWPNDLQIGGRKVAGILADGIVTGASTPDGVPLVTQVVLGYGVNVGPMAYPSDLRGRATSLESELGRAVDRADLLAETLAALAARYDDLLEGRFDAILDAWRARAPSRQGARVSWDTPSGSRSGITMDVDDWGALLVRSGARTERIVAGELRWD
jgi:BirA family biotin operon repressor/biotin-[acetyl-CoA-carboxylase] ligase